jgi:hypothetical protein
MFKNMSQVLSAATHTVGDDRYFIEPHLWASINLMIIAPTNKLWYYIDMTKKKLKKACPAWQTFSDVVEQNADRVVDPAYVNL